jgi:hypothetical protein
MLKQLLNNDITVSDIMFGLIIILGAIVLYKFSKYIFKNASSRKTENEPVFKNLIKKSDDI